METESANSIVATPETSWADYYAADGAHYRYLVGASGEVCLMKCVSSPKDMVIPEEINGMPVTGLSHAFATGNQNAERIVIPESITFIGNRAFERCFHLRTIVFPRSLDTFDNGWLRGCLKLEELYLPGCIEQLKLGIFDVCMPKKLVIGAKTRQIAEGAFSLTTLSEIEIDPQNPYLSTDGVCIYSHDGSTLLACVISADHVDVRDGCQCIGRKAFAYNKAATSVHLPDSIVEIEEYAFSNSAIESFEAPRSLRIIGRSAFYRANRLKSISLNEGLHEFGYEAFRTSGLEYIHIPASLRLWGYKAFEDTAISKKFSQDRITIDPANGTFKIDNQGLLYQVTPVHGDESELVLIECIDQQIRTCAPAPGTKRLGQQAFMRCHKLEYADLPEGLVEIGDEAFRACRALTRVRFPETLESIGNRAFYEASIANLRLPACFKHLGECAFITHVEPTITSRPTIADIDIDPGCTRYYVEDGLLYERKDDGKLTVLQYLGPQKVVTLQKEVNEIGPYAFHKISEIRQLELFDTALKINIHGFATSTQIERVILHLHQPFMGKTVLCYEFPELISNVHMINFPLKFGITSPSILQGYYDSILSMVKDPFDRARLIVDRLHDNIPLSASHKKDFEKMIERSLQLTCVLFGQHTYLTGFDQLADLGFMDENIIESVIEDTRLSANIESVSYLLALKKKRFGTDERDYSL